MVVLAYAPNIVFAAAMQFYCTVQDDCCLPARDITAHHGLMILFHDVTTCFQVSYSLQVSEIGLKSTK